MKLIWGYREAMEEGGPNFSFSRVQRTIFGYLHSFWLKNTSSFNDESNDA